MNITKQNTLEDFKKFVKEKGVSEQVVDSYVSSCQYTMIHDDVSVSMTPNIIEKATENLISMDIFSKLMTKSRIIFLGTGIDNYVANVVIGQMLYLESVTDESEAIQLYINSPGGVIYDGLAIYDTMHLIKRKVTTTCIGLAASMGFVLMVSGEKGERTGLRNSRFMQHQPLGGARGQSTDIEIAAKEIKYLKDTLYKIISEKTGQPYEKIQADCERDYWMSSTEAQDYGCIDKVLV